MLRTALLLLALTAGLSAQGFDCRACKDKGQTPCKVHKKTVELERQVLFCSVAGGCKDCSGALQIDCPRCAAPKVEQAIRARQDLVKQWLAGRRQAVGQHLDAKGLMHLETAHFHLSFAIPAGKVGKPARRQDGHRYMHTFGQRLEELYAEFCKVLELSDADFEIKGDIYMFAEQAQHQKISPLKCDAAAGSGSGQKLMGKEMVFTMWLAPHAIRGDEELHRYMVHHVTHLLINHFKPHTWIYNKGHGWLDAGLAHWFEFRLAGLCTNFCHEEVKLQVGAGWEGGHFRYGVRKLLDSKKLPPFAAILGKHTDELNLEQHGLAFAYVDFVIEKWGGKSLRLLLQEAKAGSDGSEALRKVCKIDPLRFDTEFRAFVKRKYPRRIPRRRR